MTQNHHISASLLTSVITGSVAIIPAGVLGYAEKLVSVLVLAMAAEVGRRLIAIFWKGSK